MDGFLPYIVPSIVAGTTLVGLIGLWFTQKAKIDDLSVDIVQAQKVADAAMKCASDAHVERGKLELSIEKEFVRKNDLAEVEGRLGKRMDSMSHELKNAITNLIPQIVGLRAPNARRGAPE